MSSPLTLEKQLLFAEQVPFTPLANTDFYKAGNMGHALCYI